MRLIKGGQGGSATNKNGLKFEKETSLADALETAGFSIKANEIQLHGDLVGLLLQKHHLYKFLEAEGVDWKRVLSSKLLPDEAVYSTNHQAMTIVEKKWQQTKGSVDEKLQTCGFKLRQYNRLLEPIGVSVKYIYLLNDWFADPKYQDVLDYIKEVGADFHFKSLPLDLLRLD